MNYSVPPAISSALHKHIPVLAALLLTVLIGLQIAKMVWLLIPLPEPEVASIAAAPTAQSHAPTQASLNIAQLTGAHLFGQFRPDDTPVATVADAPDTNLRLKLRGILATEDTARSRAMIEAANGELLPYAVGSDVPGGAKLHSIHPDRVLLSRGGRLETLRLEKDAPITGGGVVTTAAAEARQAGSAPQILGSDTAAKLSDIRNALLQDPTQASQFLRLQPARINGEMRGYRIYPGRDRNLFREAGLRPGDIVTAVNGVSLDDPARGLQLLGDLSTASQINLQIERGGQTQSLSVTLN